MKIIHEVDTSIVHYELCIMHSMLQSQFRYNPLAPPVGAPGLVVCAAFRFRAGVGASAAAVVGLGRAFGLGLLVGCWFQSELVRNCWGIILIAGGIFILQKK